MSNEDTTGLTGITNRLGGTLQTMMPPLHNDKTERDKMDDILRGVDRNLSTLTERVAHIQQGMDKITAKLEKMDGDLISREEYVFMRRWLTGTTIGLAVTAIVACLALAGVIAIIIYLGGL